MTLQPISPDEFDRLVDEDPFAVDFGEPPPHFPVIVSEPPARIMTDFGAIAAEQGREALDVIALDADACPRVPWDDLHDVTGALRPWQWWVVAAMTGQGKSTLALSLVAHWIAQSRPVYMLALEQPPEIIRAQLAAIRRNLDPRRVLAGEWHRLPDNAKTLIANDIAWQISAEGAELLHLNPKSDVGRHDLPRILDDAKDFGADVILIDHLHALNPGPNYQSFRDLCQALNEVPKQGRIPLITTAQMHRGDGKDPLAAHRAPKETGIQNGDVIRHFAHVVLGAWRPLAREPDKTEKALIRDRRVNLRELLEPNCLELSVMKHRINGDVVGDRVRLRYERGEIMDPTFEQRVRWNNQADETRLHV